MSISVWVLPFRPLQLRNGPVRYPLNPQEKVIFLCFALSVLWLEISGHLYCNSIITDAQHGFRKRCSCETQLIITAEDLAGEIDKGGQTDVILLDFSKVFDKVPHKLLLLKLDFLWHQRQDQDMDWGLPLPMEPSRWWSKANTATQVQSPQVYPNALS